MPTCFLAVPLPLPVRESLAQIRPPRLPGVKLVHPDKMHVTLHYLGQITTEERELVKTVLSEVEVPRFSLDLIGVGAFPERGLLRVVWAGIADHPALIRLHQELAAGLMAAIGF
ncbi:MAG TPA: RNA 2',3'-cyclic phosphodiesterase, partial [Planctomycetaceae bacterium]|nr:RNA 2',3'-cyclic phosphodiesterase [Planctomycetaceae bacterium]